MPVLFDKRVWLGALTFIACITAFDLLLSVVAIEAFIPRGPNFLIWKLLSAVGLVVASFLATLVARRGFLVPLAVFALLSVAAAVFWLTRIDPGGTTFMEAAMANLDTAAISLIAIGIGVALGSYFLSPRGP